MSAHAAHRRGRRARRGGHEEHENEERWLLTYADMITLLMALFMVLFSITSVNKTKLDILTRTLQQAFSGKILPGGTSIRDNGGGTHRQSVAPQPPIPAITPFVARQSESAGQTGLQGDQRIFDRLKRQIDAYARAHGLQNQIETTIADRGLVIRLLTDRVLFDSGRADLKPQAHPLLAKLAALLRAEAPNRPTAVEGHTDSIPITGSQYPTNWELSTARAAIVVRYLINGGAAPERFAAAGYASLHPIAGNDTAAGRSRNRRVEIVLLRSTRGAPEGGATP